MTKMKTLIAFTSETGNTKKLAHEIFNTLDGDKTLKDIKDVNNANDYDFIYIGFPIHSFGVPDIARNFIDSITTNHRVALFATHAMPTESPLNKKQIENCISTADHLQIQGIYTCVGELSESVAEQLLNSDDPQFQFFGKMRAKTIGHPNQEEITELRKFVLETQNHILV